MTFKEILTMVLLGLQMSNWQTRSEG